MKIKLCLDQNMHTKRLKIEPDQKWIKMHQCLVVGCVCICRRCWVELTGGKKSVRSLTQRKVKLESSWERTCDDELHQSSVRSSTRDFSKVIRRRQSSQSLNSSCACGVSSLVLYLQTVRAGLVFLKRIQFTPQIHIRKFEKLTAWGWVSCWESFLTSTGSALT